MRQNSEEQNNHTNVLMTTKPVCRRMGCDLIMQGVSGETSPFQGNQNKTTPEYFHLSVHKLQRRRRGGDLTLLCGNAGRIIPPEEFHYLLNSFKLFRLKQLVSDPVLQMDQWSNLNKLLIAII